MTQAALYEITGTVEGQYPGYHQGVVVQAEKVIESLTPEEINVSAVEGSTAEEVWNMIDKNVVANYSDGSTANLVSPTGITATSSLTSLAPMWQPEP